MDQKNNTPRQEIYSIFKSEKFLYICLLMTIATLTGIIFSISNSSHPYSYFFNPIISELVSAALSNIITVVVVISYIPMIIGMGLLWLMREGARSNQEGYKNSLLGIIAYRLYFLISIFYSMFWLIAINLLGTIIPTVMILMDVDSTVTTVTFLVTRVILVAVSLFCVFLIVYLYNASRFLGEVALSIRINKNMITKNKTLIYCNYIFAGLMVISAPFSGFAGFIYNIAFAAVLILINVCIYDHNYKYEAADRLDVDDFYKNIVYNPEYKEVADALGVKQKEGDIATLNKSKATTERFRTIIDMMSGSTLYDGDMFKEDEENENSDHYNS